MAIGKISTDTAHRAVPRRQLSFLSVSDGQCANAILLLTLHTDGIEVAHEVNLDGTDRNNGHTSVYFERKDDSKLNKVQKNPMIAHSGDVSLTWQHSTVGCVTEEENRLVRKFDAATRPLQFLPPDAMRPRY